MRTRRRRGNGGPRKLIRQIAESASPTLKQQLSGLVLTDCIMGREINCIESLREAAIIVALSSKSHSEWADAMDVLEEVGFRNADQKLFATASLLTPNMREKLAELATVGHIVKGGPRRLIEATAVLFAIKDYGSPENKAAIAVLARLGINNEESRKTFTTLVTTGLLQSFDEAAFQTIQKEVARLVERTSFPPTSPADQASEPEPPIEAPQSDALPPPSPASPEIPREAEELPCEVEAVAQGPRPESLPSPQHEGFEPKEGVAFLVPLRQPPHVRKKKKSKEKSPKPTKQWAERQPLPDTLSFTELRRASLKGMQVSERQMYGLICVHCFRLCTSKALIGEVYAPLAVVRMNLVRMLNGDKELQAHFDSCWQKMKSANALYKKSKLSGVASLNPHASEITDQTIRAVVEEALGEHRRIIRR